MKKVKCLVAFVVSLFVMGSLGISSYAVADPMEEDRPILDVPDWARDMVPIEPESPPLHKEKSPGGGSSDESEVQGQPEGGGGGASPLGTINWRFGHTCVQGFPESYEGHTINLGGNLIIEPGCTLTFINVIMNVMEEWNDWQIRIDVQASGSTRGTFEVLGGSHILATTTPYEFEVDGELRVSGSWIQDLQGGLKFFSSSIGDIESSSTISDSDSHVIYAANPHKLDIKSSTVKNSGGSNTHGIYVNGGEANVYIYDSDVHSNVEYGIYVYGSGPSMIPEPIPLPPIPGTRFGYFVWVTDTDWHIEWSTINGTSATFNGTVKMPTSNYSFNETVTYGGGSGDYNVEDSATFDLWVNGTRVDEDLIVVGKYEENPSSNPFELRRLWMVVEQSDIHSNWGGMYVENSSPQIKGNDIYSNIEHGVAVKEASPAIDDNDMTNNNYGVYAISDSSHTYSWAYSPIVVENTITVTGGAPSPYTSGMFFETYSYPRVRDNTISGDFKYYAYVILIKDHSKGVFKGNEITRIATANPNIGFFIWESSPTVHLNTVERMSGGIWIYRCVASTPQVTYNTIRHAWSGIYLWGSSSWATVSHNSVWYSDRGIDVSSSMAYVTYNTVKYNNYGIVTRIYPGSATTSPLVAHNTVTENYVHGIHAYDRSTPTIIHNTVTLNGENGICLCPYAGYKEIGQATIGGDTADEKNTLSGNGKFGINLTYNKPANFGPWQGDGIQDNIDQNVFSGSSGDGRIIQNWWTTILVTYLGNPQPDADVWVWEYDSCFEEGEEYWSGKTEGNGKTPELTLKEIIVYNDGSHDLFTPHCVKAKKLIGGFEREGQRGDLYMTQNRPDFEVQIQ